MKSLWNVYDHSFTDLEKDVQRCKQLNMDDLDARFQEIRDEQSEWLLSIQTRIDESVQSLKSNYINTQNGVLEGKIYEVEGHLIKS